MSDLLDSSKIILFGSIMVATICAVLLAYLTDRRDR